MNESTLVHQLATQDLPKLIEAGLAMKEDGRLQTFRFVMQQTALLTSIRGEATRIIYSKRNALLTQIDAQFETEAEAIKTRHEADYRQGDFEREMEAIRGHYEPAIADVYTNLTNAGEAFKERYRARMAGETFRFQAQEQALLETGVDRERTSKEVHEQTLAKFGAEHLDAWSNRTAAAKARAHALKQEWDEKASALLSRWRQHNQEMDAQVEAEIEQANARHLHQKENLNQAVDAALAKVNGIYDQEIASCHEASAAAYKALNSLESTATLARTTVWKELQYRIGIDLEQEAEKFETPSARES